MKGTREAAPSRIPQSKYDALFDKRHIFDAIRESFLFSAGTPDSMVILLEAIASERDLSPTARAQLENFRSEVHHHRAALAEPQAVHCFGEEAWPYYVQALQDENYWLSVGELVLLCHLAGVRIIVFKQTGAVLKAEASNLAGSGEVIFVKIAIDADAHVRVRSHFERTPSARTFAALESECQKQKRSGSAVVRKRRNGRLRPPRVAASVSRATASQRAAALHASDASGSVSRALPPASDPATPSSGAAQILGDRAPSSAAAPPGDAALPACAATEAAVASDSDAPSHLVGEISDAESSVSRRSSATRSRASDEIPEIEAAPDANDDESFSDVSSDSDLFNVSTANSPKERTPQDVDLEHIARIKNMLRRFPSLP